MPSRMGLCQLINDDLRMQLKQSIYSIERGTSVRSKSQHAPICYYAQIYRAYIRFPIRPTTTVFEWVHSAGRLYCDMEQE